MTMEWGLGTTLNKTLIQDVWLPLRSRLLGHADSHHGFLIKKITSNKLLYKSGRTAVKWFPRTLTATVIISLIVCLFQSQTQWSHSISWRQANVPEAETKHMYPLVLCLQPTWQREQQKESFYYFIIYDSFLVAKQLGVKYKSLDRHGNSSSKQRFTGWIIAQPFIGQSVTWPPIGSSACRTCQGNTLSTLFHFVVSIKKSIPLLMKQLDDT